MDKRLILAMALSLLVLLTWSALVSKIYHIDNKKVTTKSTPEIGMAPALIAPLHLKLEVPLSSLWKFSQGKFEVIFNESQAAMQDAIFKEYQSYRFPLQYAFLLGDKNLVFKKESTFSEGVIFVYRDNEKKITKQFIFFNSNYSMELEIEWQNLSASALNINPDLVLGVLNFGPDNLEARFQDVTLAGKDRILHLNGRKDSVFEAVKFLGLRERYFCAIIEPATNNYTGFIKKINPQESEIGLRTEEILLNPGQQIKQKFRIYLGPQDLKIINRINPDWSAVMYYGTFNFISHLFLQLLAILYQLVHNWGTAIVILSIIIYFFLYPLTIKQMRSMKQMQALQPRIEEIRKLYKDNPQKLNKEIMELYRQHKVNPFGGCLPLILQIPVFFALYQALMRSVALKGSHFLWIKDLSEPDRLFMLPVSLPILGKEINILPILMTIGMFIQQKTSMASASSGSAEQQKLMLILFPLMFGFIFYRMPSGLVLYWFINSTLMLGYQFRMSQKK